MFLADFLALSFSLGSETADKKHIMSCAGVEPRSEADCEYTLDSGMLIKDIGYRCYSQIWNCYSHGKLIEGDKKSISLS